MEERKDNKYKEEQTDKAGYLSHDTTCRCYSVYYVYELSILYGCGNIFDENVERKKKGHKQRRINRMPVLNPMLQQIIVNLHTNY